ncbi:MAG: DUF502 domain-containing protein [Pirellulaceae bacterium]|jgi:uncharacterized membrane protein|nr:DUF502 domain-containing protein [Pirellulaceae bacterium]
MPLRLIRMGFLVMTDERMQDSTKTEPKWSLIAAIRNRIIEGLLLVLPFAITYWVISWLYMTFRGLILNAVIAKVVEVIFGAGVEPPEFFVKFIAPAIAILIVLFGLYILGMFLHSRIHRLIDWVILHVPGVTVIYAAMRKLFTTLQTQRHQVQKFQRVVLVPFPHPGMKVPAFVTSSCVDVATGKTILCVYVPTTPVPTSGYMLMLPEEDATEVSWSLDESLQAIISGGISVPAKVEYFPIAG